MSDNLDRLKSWRKQLVEKVGPQANKWFSNKALEAVVEANPPTLEELEKVKYMGPSLVASYGAAILNALGSGTEIDIGKPDDGLDAASFPSVKEEEAAKEYHHARIPKDLIPFVEYSDKFFSPMKQQAMAEKRRDTAWAKAAAKAAESGFVGSEAATALMNRSRPDFITTALDLLILREKREERDRLGGLESISPPFTVCGRTAEPNSRSYENVLAAALSFIDSCLYLEDAEGKPLSKYAVAERLKAIGVPFPEEYAEFRYLEDYPVPPQSYWPDAANYAHLTKLRHRAMDEA